MPDIFLSYSAEDTQVAERIAELLEMRGYSIWYDKMLTPGENVRNAVVKALDSAHAVIVIWSEASTKSDFVIAEAARARALEKLISVRTPNISADDIPVPFNHLRMINLNNTSDLITAIEAATKAKSRPATIRGLWFHLVFSYIGILGATLSLFSSLEAVLELASWARWITSRWADLTHTLWSVAFNVLGISITISTSSILTVITLLTLIFTSGQLQASAYLVYSQRKEKRALVSHLEEVASIIVCFITFLYLMDPALALIGSGPSVSEQIGTASLLSIPIILLTLMLVIEFEGGYLLVIRRFVTTVMVLISLSYISQISNPLMAFLR